MSTSKKLCFEIGEFLHTAFLPCATSASQPQTVVEAERRKLLPLRSMPRGVKKENLPSKICVTCNRPFTWRKVWEKCWDEVLTCSDRCKNERKKALQQARRAERGSTPDQGAAPGEAATATTADTVQEH